jgi:GntR family transcriptional regulator, galactonate operon transcriptional repressor
MDDPEGLGVRELSGYAGRGLHGQVVNELGRRIVSGKLVPETPIDLAQLEAELDVSRTALREALKVLAAKGLVDARQKRGTFVRPRRDWHLLDADLLRWQLAEQPTGALLSKLAEVRSIVEPAGARLAAQRRDEDDLGALAAALTAMAESDPASVAAVDADLAFHAALLAASHNELLIQMEAMIEVGLAARDMLVHTGHGGAVQDPVPAHRAVYEAVRDGDPDAAERAMRALLDQALRDAERVRRAEGST